MPKTQPNLYAFPGADALAPALRSYILKAQSLGIDRHGVFKLAVSGGSLPALLAAALLPAPTSPSDVVHFAQWEIFFADERAVALDHKDSNAALLRAELIDKIPAGQPRPAVHPIDPAFLADTQELAAEYEKTLVQAFASRDSVRLPIFDLVLLGCGPDGHTCSLFPGHALLREDSAWVAAIEDSPKEPPRRITLTLPVVNHAVRVAFVAMGAGKSEVLKSIFDRSEGLPCALVNEACGDRCSWFVDEPAVEGVIFPRRAFL